MQLAPSFKNPCTTGHTYKSCGGESVVNQGCEHLVAIDSHDTIIHMPFQVTDKITRVLLSVSKLCEQGHACYFGPGPQFNAYIIHDPKAVTIAPCRKTPINIKGGVYEIGLGEVVRKHGVHAVDDHDNVEWRMLPG